MKRKLYKQTLVRTVSLTSLLGETIRATRNDNGWSQEEFARRLKCAQSAVSRYETGTMELSVEVLFSIATVLQVRSSDLLRSAEDELYTLQKAKKR